MPSRFNFRALVPHDAVYDRSATSHAVNLFDMASKYADVATTAEILERLRPLSRGAIEGGASALERNDVVLDMTRDSIAPEARAVEKRKAILPRTDPYLAWARGKGQPVVFVCSARRKTDKWFLKFWELANEIWKPGQPPIAELYGAEKDTVVHKRRYSGFFGSDLELTLRELDVGSLQLIGWSTSLAVATTAIDALAARLSDHGGERLDDRARVGRPHGRRKPEVVARFHRRHGEVEDRALRRTDAMSIDGRATRRALNEEFDYYSLQAAETLGLAGVSRLPCSLKVVLENVLRQHGEGRSDGSDIAAVAGWLATRRAEREIAFRFTRVLMPDSSGVPLLGDLAAMRDAMIRLGGDPARLNPSVPVDLVVDHSVMVDAYGVPDAVSRNKALELKRNAERYAFLRWGAQAFDKLRIVPPGNGILHQINLEYLARVVWTTDRVAYPDSVLGMDSHTAMINSLGILGWGVGGLEGGAGALGESVAMLVPEVIGCRLVGAAPGVTSTDIVLTVTQTLRRHNVVEKFVEYFGPGSRSSRSPIAPRSPT